MCVGGGALDIPSRKATPLINYTRKIIIFFNCLLSVATFPNALPLAFRTPFVYSFVYFCVCPPPPSCLHHMVARSNNVKHFALASFRNLQFQNVRPVESRSDNGHALPPVALVPPYLPSINATAGVSCNNTCTSELSTRERERRGRRENRGRNTGRRLRLGRKDKMRKGGKQLKVDRDAMTGPVCRAAARERCMSTKWSRAGHDWRLV